MRDEEDRTHPRTRTRAGEAIEPLHITSDGPVLLEALEKRRGIVESSGDGSGRRSKRSACYPPPQVIATECQNVFCFPVDAAALQPVRHVFETLRPSAGEKKELTFKPKRFRFHVERPTWKSVSTFPFPMPGQPPSSVLIIDCCVSIAHACLSAR